LTGQTCAVLAIFAVAALQASVLAATTVLPILLLFLCRDLRSLVAATA
jgi:hypothetical protein